MKLKLTLYFFFSLGAALGHISSHLMKAERAHEVTVFEVTHGNSFCHVVPLI